LTSSMTDVLSIEPGMRPARELSGIPG